MLILKVAYYEVLKYIRDIRIMAILIVFPNLLFIFVGTGLESVISNSTDSKFNVGIVNLDKEFVGKSFDAFIQKKEIIELLDIKKLNSKDDGLNSLENDSVNFLIFIEENTTKKLQDEKNNGNINIQLYGKTDLMYIESLVNNFIESIKTQNATMKLVRNPVIIDKEDNIEKINSKTTKIPDAMDYYAILNTLQILFLGAVFGVLITSKKQNSDIEIRNNLLPIRKFNFILAKTIGCTFLLIIISIIVVLCSKYIFDANWDGNYLLIIGTLILYCVISIGFGLLIGLFTKKMINGLGLVGLLSTAFGMMSGSLVPVNIPKYFTLINPNYHARQLLFGIIYNYPKNILIEALIVLCIFVLILYGTTILLFRRYSYDNI
ncbi:MAG: ABC transporter permease [Clostridiales bacterium]